MQNHIMMRAALLVAPWALVTSATAGNLPWNTLSEAAHGPDYPTSGRVRFSVGEALLPAVQRSQIEIGLNNVLCDGSVVPAGLLGGDDGSAAALHFSVGSPTASNLIVDMPIAAFGDGSVRRRAVMQDFHFNTAAFDLNFDVLLGDGSVHRHAWRGVISSAQPFEFINADVAVLGDGSVRLLLDLHRLPGNQILTEPVVAMTLSANLVPEPTTALLLALGALAFHRRRRGH